MALRLSLRQGRSFTSAGGQASSAFLHSSLGGNTFSAKRSSEPTKQPLKKPVTPVGRFDTPEESNVEKESLENNISLTSSFSKFFISKKLYMYDMKEYCGIPFKFSRWYYAYFITGGSQHFFLPSTLDSLWVALCFTLKKANIKISHGYTEFPNDINPTTKEKGGPRGPEPTRYGDWERKGRCIDF